MSIDRALSAHIHSAIFLLEEQGVCLPMMWAESDTQRIIAVTRSQEAATSDTDRTWILAWMIDAIEAHTAGRTDEVWTRAMTADEAQGFRPGDLHHLAEIDPTIRTALVVHAVNLQTGAMAAALAQPEIDDDGTTEWSVTRPAAVGGANIASLVEARTLARMIERDNSTMAERVTRLRRAVDEWTIERFSL